MMHGDFENSKSVKTGSLFLVGWTTVAKRKDAERLAEGLVTKKLASCVQMDCGVKSYYLWKGKLENDEEIRLWVKFRGDREPELVDYLQTHHPYETPQWVTVPIHSITKSYGAWMNEISESSGQGQDNVNE